MDDVLKDIGIDESQDRIAIKKNGGIVCFKTLKEKKSALESRSLIGVPKSAQTTLGVLLNYLETEEGDLSSFNRSSFETFVVTKGKLPFNPPLIRLNNDGRTQEDHDGSGNESGPANKKRKMGPDDGTIAREVIEVSGDEDDDGVLISMEVDNSETESSNGIRKVKISTKKGAAAVGTSKTHELKPFELIPQGFDPKDSNGFLDNPEDDTKARFDAEMSSRKRMVFQGRRLCRDTCYEYTKVNGMASVVAIKRFKSESEAYCVAIKPVEESFLGDAKYSRMEGDKKVEFSFSDILKKWYDDCHFFQIEGLEVVKLSDLGLKCGNSYSQGASPEDPKPSQYPEKAPKLIYAPRSPGDRSFAYYRDNDSCQTLVPRNSFRLIEGFAGAGGMHLGFEAEGYETAMAIEYDKAAVETLRHNNADLPIYHGDIRKFIAKIEDDPEYSEEVGSVDAVHVSSPCQGFSKANRNKTETEKDKRNNELSYTLLDFLKLKKPLVGTLENVEGMWSKKGISYLQNILMGAMMMGYQARVMVLQSCDYGDAQKRPRLIIFVAQNHIKLPNAPVKTHGPGRAQPFATPRQKIGFLSSTAGKKMSFPNMNVCRTTNLEEGEHGTQKLPADIVAPAVLASGPAVKHYEENRCTNVREMAALQGFPWTYEFRGSLTEQYKQAGNAVPVEFSRAIARAVKESLRWMYVKKGVNKNPMKKAVVAASKDEQPSENSNSDKGNEETEEIRGETSGDSSSTKKDSETKEDPSGEKDNLKESSKDPGNETSPPSPDKLKGGTAVGTATKNTSSSDSDDMVAGKEMEKENDSETSPSSEAGTGAENAASKEDEEAPKEASSNSDNDASKETKSTESFIFFSSSSS